MPKNYEYRVLIGNDGKYYAVFNNDVWWHRSGRTKAGNSIG